MSEVDRARKAEELLGGPFRAIVAWAPMGHIEVGSWLGAKQVIPSHAIGDDEFEEYVRYAREVIILGMEERLAEMKAMPFPATKEDAR